MAREMVKKQIGAACKVCGEKFLMDQLDGILIPRHASQIPGLDCKGGNWQGIGIYVELPSVRKSGRENY